MLKDLLIIIKKSLNNKMNFNPSRASAIEKLNKFAEQNLFEYSRLRNFDYGPDNRSNISCLSLILLMV